jgi:hypothetical protein
VVWSSTEQPAVQVYHEDERSSGSIATGCCRRVRPPYTQRTLQPKDSSLPRTRSCPGMSNVLRGLLSPSLLGSVVRALSVLSATRTELALRAPDRGTISRHRDFNHDEIAADRPCDARFSFLIRQESSPSLRLARHPVHDQEMDARAAVHLSVEAIAKAPNGFLARAARN